MVCAGRMGSYTLFSFKNWKYCFRVDSIIFASEIKNIIGPVSWSCFCYNECKMAEILLLFSVFIDLKKNKKQNCYKQVQKDACKNYISSFPYPFNPPRLYLRANQLIVLCKSFHHCICEPIVYVSPNTSAIRSQQPCNQPLKGHLYCFQCFVIINNVQINLFI